MEGMTPREIDLAGTDGGMHARVAQNLISAGHYIETHPDLPIPADIQSRAAYVAERIAAIAVIAREASATITGRTAA